MHPKDAEQIANSVDPDQTVWSGSALFAQTCLSENLGKLRYIYCCKVQMENSITQENCSASLGKTHDAEQWIFSSHLITLKILVIPALAK